MEAPIRDSLGQSTIPQSWVTWFKTVDNFIRSGSSSGTTANRPTKNLFVGLSYMDDTLGKQIQIKSLNPTVWVDSAGEDPDVPAVVVADNTFISAVSPSITVADFFAEKLRSGNYWLPCIDVTGKTQVRMRGKMSLNSIASDVTIGMCYGTSVTDSTVNELTADGYTAFAKNFTVSTVDTDWHALADGVTGEIYPSMWNMDGTATANQLVITDAQFMFK